MSWLKLAQKFDHIISETSLSIHDIDRYRTDKYECYVSLVKSATSYDIGFQVNSSQLGVASNVEYWHYKLNELNQAKKTYNTVAQETRAVVKKSEVQKTPFALYGPKFRAAMRNVDPDHKDISGIYHTNKNIKNPLADDWRETIYGPRYPDTPAIGNTIDGFFSYQPKHPVQQIETKNISAQGTGRKKQWSISDA